MHEIESMLIVEAAPDDQEVKRERREDRETGEKTERKQRESLFAKQDRERKSCFFGAGVEENKGGKRMKTAERMHGQGKIGGYEYKRRRATAKCIEAQTTPSEHEATQKQ